MKIIARIGLEVQEVDNMKVREMYYLTENVDNVLIMFEFSMRYEEHNIEDYFDRQVYGIHAIDKNTIGFKIEGNRYKP